MNLIMSNLQNISQSSATNKTSCSFSSSSSSNNSISSTPLSISSIDPIAQTHPPDDYFCLNEQEEYEDDEFLKQQAQDLEILNFSSYINKNLNEKQTRDLFYKDYILGHEIGKGGFGTVFSGFKRATNQPVAIKVIRKSKVTQWYEFNPNSSLLQENNDCIYEMDCVNSVIYTKRIPLEIALMIRVRHVKNCVKILDYLEQKNCFIIVMERFEMGKDLFDIITESSFTGNGLSEAIAKNYFKQIVESILSIHKLGVLHRDIKDENILIDLSTNQIKLIDFGAGAFQSPKKLNQRYTDFHGTRVYSPPEWILNKSYHGDRAAVWSLGVLLFNMIYGDVPWEEDDDIINCRLNIKKNLLNPTDLSRNQFSRLRGDVDDLIKQCLIKDETMRISLDQILYHKWFN